MTDNPRQRELVDGYCSGNLSEAEFRELEEALREHPELRRELLEARMMEADLRDHTAGQVGLSLYSEPSADQGRTVRRLRHELWAMAAVIAILLGGIVALLTRSQHRAGSQLDQGVAVLTRAIDAQWQGTPWRQGDSVTPGWLRLEAGTVELEFYSGASIILEAPAELDVQSENGGLLIAGKLRAQVPLHAQGFTITTPEIELVDLGTSFGMEVGAETGTAVHVFDGEVELYAPDQPRDSSQGQPLLAGEGRHIHSDGEVAVITANDSEFLSPAEFDLRARQRLERGLSRWQEQADVLSGRSDLLAHYDFQPADAISRVLPNRSELTGAGLDGSIIGSRWEAGRWPGKRALEFKRPSDRVRIRFPGTHESLTLIAWVRIDGFDNLFSSLLLSDGWRREGAVHWQIHQDDFIELAVYYGPQKKTYNSRAPFAMEPSDFGRWMQLAVSYDGETGIVTHYRDGQAIGAANVDVVVPLAIGDAEIGNWTPPEQRRQIRQFNGRMDEMIVFEGVLSPEAIAELYRDGKP